MPLRIRKEVKKADILLQVPSTKNIRTCMSFNRG